MTQIKTLKEALAMNRRSLLKAGIGGVAIGVLGAPYVITGARAAQPLAGKKIGFSQSYATDEWLKIQREDVTTSAAKHGLEVTALDARNSPEQEIRNLEDLAVRGVDAVIMITYFASAVQVGVQALNDAGIPIIVMSSSLGGGAQYAAHLAADTLGTARQAGEYYVKALNGSGVVAQIEGKAGSVVNQQRGQGWHDVIDKVPGIKVAARGTANYSRTEALTLMQDFLQANRKIDAVYCHNDNMAKGALQAIEEAGRAKEMWLTGFDGATVETFQMIEAGRLRGSFVYPTFGAEAIEVTAAILQKKEVKKEIVFASPMVTKENLSQFYDASKKERIVPPVDMTTLGL